MRTWRVHRLGGFDEVMQMEDAPDPTPSAGQVVLDVEAASVGFPDLLQILGFYQTRPTLPYTPGREFAGVVSGVGDGVTELSKGDRVLTIAGGGFAEKAVVAASDCLPIPDEVTAVDAAAMLVNYGTAVLALEDRGRLQPGESLLVTAAAGGVGSAAVQVGKALGATVIGLAGGADKLALVREIGADLAFDYNKVDVVDVVRAATDRGGVDVCFEAVGGNVFDQVCRVMAWGGRLLVVGFASGHIPAPPTNYLLLKGYSLVGVNSEATVSRDPSELPRIWHRVVTLFQAGAIAPVVHQTRPLDEIPQALADLASRDTVGKVVIAP